MAELPSKNSIVRASRTLRDAGPDFRSCTEELEIASLWRAAHIEPIRELFTRMALASGDIPDSLVISRLKRIETIVRKLRRDNLSVNLRTMDDIAGCRMIVPDIESAYSAYETLAAYPDVKSNYTKDYISNPKQDGYRGIHLVYKIPSEVHPGKNLFAEAQIRTKTMHAWAVAVEMYGNIKGNHLKLGEGTDEERRFFYLMSTLFRAYEEYKIDQAFEAAANEAKEIDSKLDILSLLQSSYDSMYAFGPESDSEEGGYYLLNADYSDQTIRIALYSDAAADEASEQYAKYEIANENLQDSLLAKAPGIEDLKLALPNYFSDMRPFLELAEKVLG